MTQLNTFTRKTDGVEQTIYAQDINELQNAIEDMDGVTEVTTTYTALADDDVVLGDATSAGFTITLPTAADITGKKYTFKRTSASNNVTIDGASSETIDGATTKALASQYAFITIVSDGTNWHIIATGGTIS